MTRGREWALVALVALAAAGAGYGYHVWRQQPAGAQAAGLEAMKAAKLPDLEGRPQSLDQWRGKVLVVNFWATWCAPCREEIPLLVKLQDKYGPRGLQIVGIAIDQPGKVRPYAAELGMNFPILIGGLDAIELARGMGNRAGVLPFTLIVGRDGKVAATEVGAVKEPTIDPLLASLL